MRKPRRDEGPDAGLPRHYLRACLALLVGEAPAHGYEMLSQITELGLAGTDPGGLYRTLRTMESDGLVESYWQDSSAGPLRRTYRLTPIGADWLERWAGVLAESHRHVSVYLRRHSRMDEYATSEGAP